MILHTSGWRTDVRWETNCLSFFFYTDLTFRSPLALLTVKVDHAKLWWIIWEKRDKLSPHAFTLDKPSTQLLPAIITGNVQRTTTDAKLSLQPWTPSPTTDTNVAEDAWRHWQQQQQTQQQQHSNNNAGTTQQQTQQQKQQQMQQQQQQQQQQQRSDDNNNNNAATTTTTTTTTTAAAAAAATTTTTTTTTTKGLTPTLTTA